MLPFSVVTSTSVLVYVGSESSMEPFTVEKSSRPSQSARPKWASTRPLTEAAEANPEVDTSIAPLTVLHLYVVMEVDSIYLTIHGAGDQRHVPWDSDLEVYQRADVAYRLVRATDTTFVHPSRPGRVDDAYGHTLGVVELNDLDATDVAFRVRHPHRNLNHISVGGRRVNVPVYSEQLEALTGVDCDGPARDSRVPA